METTGSNFRPAGSPDPFSRASLQPTADFILSKISITPVIGIICGSGLGELAELVSDALVLPYSSIPGFPVSTAPGHQGQLVFGSLSGARVVLMQGRLHVYEGHPLWRCTMPVRILRMVGVTQLIVTNAVGGLNPAYKVGDIMLVKDHINMFGLAAESPLRGPNDESFGPRFFPINDLYSKRARSIARAAAEEVGISHTVHEGVLSISGGPNYESVGELKMFSMLGVDCIGMSSIPESLVAHHCGMTVLAFCLVTNQCCLDINSHTSAAPDHQEVLDAAEMKKHDLKNFVTVLVEKLDNNRDDNGDGSNSLVEKTNGTSTNGIH